MAAFAHALVAAVNRKTDLTILHLSNRTISRKEWHQFPAVRETLERWGLLPEGSKRSDVRDKLGIRVKKVSLETNRPMTAIKHYLDEYPVDLLVMAVGREGGLPGWLHSTAFEQLAVRGTIMTLAVPSGVKGFVSQSDGSAKVQRLLIPVDHDPDPQASLFYASRVAKAYGSGEVEIMLVHVGSSTSAPSLDLPEDSSSTWNIRFQEGNPVEVIVDVAETFEPDLIIMPTRKNKGILQVLRGSVTGEVAGQIRCPLLAVPS